VMVSGTTVLGLLLLERRLSLLEGMAVAGAVGSGSLL